MSVEDQINTYIASQTETKRFEMVTLHQNIQNIMTNCRLWYLDGKNAEGKIISNPNIGYGFQTIKYANGTAKEFYQIGLSANTVGISIYILGIENKNTLAQIFGEKLGKASITGYCIKFKTIKDINMDILEAAIRFGIESETKKLIS